MGIGYVRLGSTSPSYATQFTRPLILIVFSLISETPQHAGLFAYGQSGGGKTYTLMGKEGDVYGEVADLRVQS